MCVANLNISLVASTWNWIHTLPPWPSWLGLWPPSHTSSFPVPRPPYICTYIYIHSYFFFFLECSKYWLLKQMFLRPLMVSSSQKAMSTLLSKWQLLHTIVFCLFHCGTISEVYYCYLCSHNDCFQTLHLIYPPGQHVWDNFVRWGKCPILVLSSVVWFRVSTEYSKHKRFDHRMHFHLGFILRTWNAKSCMCPRVSVCGGLK